MVMVAVAQGADLDPVQEVQDAQAVRAGAIYGDDHRLALNHTALKALVAGGAYGSFGRTNQLSPSRIRLRPLRQTGDRRYVGAVWWPLYSTKVDRIPDQKKLPFPLRR